MALLSDFLTALRSAPATGQQLNKAEAKLIAERERTASATVHIDDVVAKALDGTRKRASGAISHLLAHHLNAESMAATHAGSIENQEIVFDLLALTTDKPTPANALDPKGTAAIFPQGTTPHSGILTYLLLPQVEQAVEKLVRDNLTEACKGGIRLTERRKKLAEIDGKLADIRAQRTALAEGLREAARHVTGAPESFEKGPTNADQREAAATLAREAAATLAREAAREAADFARQTGEMPAGV